MLVMTGIDHKAAKGNPHIVFSEDGLAALWAGTIDDLWSLGKPVGKTPGIETNAVPYLSPDAISKKYPEYAPSLYNLIRDTEDRIKKIL